MIRMDTAPAARGVWKKLGGRLATPLLWGAATLIREFDSNTTEKMRKSLV